MDEDEEDYGEEGEDEFAALASEAFPDQEFDAARLSALKQLIHLCVSGGDEADDEDEDEPATPGRGKPALELVFGIGGKRPKKKG
jgi:hypothetical protein